MSYKKTFLSGKDKKFSINAFDSVSIVIGIAVGAGIFKTPGIVAQCFSSPSQMLLIWIIGGLFCFAGALTYLQLAKQYPEIGGEYQYLSRFYKQPVSFLYGWSRMTIIQTGSIASIAYIFGDYAQNLLPIGSASPMLYACVAVGALTVFNILGIRISKNVQNLLTLSIVAGLTIFCIIALNQPSQPVVLEKVQSFDLKSLGLGLVFVLYTYGGWSEAAYTTGELRNRERNMVYVFILSIILLIGIYFLVNLAYLSAVGFQGMQNSDFVAGEALRITLGDKGGTIVSILIIFATLSSINGSIFTGARTIVVLGNNHPVFKKLGIWNPSLKTPVHALIWQGGISIALILLAGIGKNFRSSFETLVEYTAPVFWLFLLLIGISSFSVFKENNKSIRLFFSSIGLIFCAMCIFMLYSSIVYTKFGALFGVAILFMGLPIYYFSKNNKNEI